MFHHDYLLLAAGLCRVVLWSVGAWYAWHRRRPLAFVGFTMGALSAVVFGFANAHFDVPYELVAATAYVAVLIPGCIVGSFVLHAHTNRHWRL